MTAAPRAPARSTPARSALALAALSAAGIACSAAPPPAAEAPPPPAADAPAPARAAEGAQALPRAEAALRALLAAEPGGKGAITIDHVAGPLGTTIVRGSVAGAYPGTGVRATLLGADGVTYGAHGDQGLADLVRARGWIERPPAADALLALVNAGEHEGLLMVEEAPAASVNDGVLELRFVRRTFPSLTRVQVVVRIGKTGPSATEERDVEEPVVTAEPADVIAAAERALADKRFRDALRSMDATKGMSDARVVPLMVRATTADNDLVAATAFERLRPTPDVAKALVAAWAALPPERRAALCAMARERYGKAFADTLQ